MARRLTMTKVIGAVTAATLVAGTSVAFGYFTGSGTGTGTANVGSSSPFTVSFGTVTGGPLLPGSAGETLPYTVTNAGSGTQQLTTTTATVVASAGGFVTHGGTAVTGCLASWFTAVNTPATGTLAHAASATGSVAVSMPDASVNQDACQGVSPDITVAAS